jgi:hypothetical protein
MSINTVSQNPYSNAPINVHNTLLKETSSGSANTMPNIDRTIIEPHVSRKANNNIPANYLKQVYMGNHSSSNGSLTESFIRARASFSPSYMHNEIATRYNMISAIPMKLINIKKTLDKIA